MTATMIRATCGSYQRTIGAPSTVLTLSAASSLIRVDDLVNLCSDLPTTR